MRDLELVGSDRAPLQAVTTIGASSENGGLGALTLVTPAHEHHCRSDLRPSNMLGQCSLLCWNHR